MKENFFISLLIGLFSLSANAALKEGDAAPNFEAQASLNGKSFNFSLKDALKKGPVVVYFYPSAYTGGCNIQAHTFAELHDQFSSAGATVIGVSLDSIERLNEFSADPDYCAGKFPVASDVGGKIAKSYELNIREASPGRTDTKGKEINHGFAERTTFVITSDGKVNETIGGITPIQNVDKALDVVQKIAAKNISKKR